MGPIVVALLVIVAGGAMIFFFARRVGAEFAVEVRDGAVERVQGEAPDWFVTDVQRICGLWGVRRGTIRGIRVGPRRIHISVSGGIPQRHRRAFQNAWDHPL